MVADEELEAMGDVIALVTGPLRQQLAKEPPSYYDQNDIFEAAWGDIAGARLKAAKLNAAHAWDMF